MLIMFRTIIVIIKIFAWMLKQDKLRKLCLKYQKEGNKTERDKIVAQKVPEWANYCLDVTGTKVEVKGLEKLPEEPCVFIANHQGYMDIPSIYGNFPKKIAFIAKVEINMVPYIRDWMNFLECTFMDRKSPRKSIQAIHDAAEGVKRGYSQVIFPEGHRSKGAPHIEFKAGSFKLAFLSEAPIVPVTIENSYKVFEENGAITKGNTIILTVHDPIPTKGITKEEQQAIPAKVEAIVCEQLKPAEEAWIAAHPQK